MNTLRVALPLAGLLLAAPAFAQAPPPPGGPVAPAEANAKPDEMALHERCKAVMGARMQPRQPHDHSRDKQGLMAGPRAKPLSKAEMARLHAQCQAMLNAETPGKK